MAEDKGHLKRFAALVLGGGLYQAGLSTISTVIGPLLNLKGMSAGQIGFLNSSNWAVVTLTSIPAGRLSDTIGRLVPFIVSATAAAAAWAMLFLKADFAVAFVAFTVAGLSIALFTPNSTAIVSETFKPAIAPILFAVFYLSTWGGAAIASVLSGWASENLGVESPLLMASVFYVLSGVFLVGSAWSRKARAPPKRGTGVRHLMASMDLRSILLSVRNNPLLASYAFALFFHTFGFLMITPYLSLYAEKVVGLDMVGVGLVMAAWSIGLMAGIIPWGWISAKMGSEVTLAGHFVLSAISWSAVTLSRDMVTAVALMFFFGLVGSMDLPARRALTAELSPPDKLAEATGFVELVTGLGGLMGSLIGGLFWERLGPVFPFYIGSAMTLLSVPPMVRLATRVRNSPHTSARDHAQPPLGRLT